MIDRPLQGCSGLIHIQYSIGIVLSWDKRIAAG